MIYFLYVLAFGVVLLASVPVVGLLYWSAVARGTRRGLGLAAPDVEPRKFINSHIDPSLRPIYLFLPGHRVWVIEGPHCRRLPTPQGTMTEEATNRGGLVAHDDGTIYGWSSRELMPLSSVSWSEYIRRAIVGRFVWSTLDPLSGFRLTDRARAWEREQEALPRASTVATAPRATPRVHVPPEPEAPRE